MKPKLERPKAVPDAIPVARPPLDGVFSTDHPFLFAHLTDLTYGDGTPRQSSTMLFFVEEGQWKACLNDRAEGLYCFFAGPSMVALIDTMEAKLATGKVEWRKSKFKK